MQPFNFQGRRSRFPIARLHVGTAHAVPNDSVTTTHNPTKVIPDGAGFDYGRENISYIGTQGVCAFKCSGTTQASSSPSESAASPPIGTALSGTDRANLADQRQPLYPARRRRSDSRPDSE